MKGLFEQVLTNIYSLPSNEYQELKTYVGKIKQLEEEPNSNVMEEQITNS